MSSEIFNYKHLLLNIKQKIVDAQYRVVTYANKEVLSLYWGIGKEIEERKKQEGWGAKVIEKLAYDLKNELTDVRGFAATNLKKMSIFYRAYPDLGKYFLSESSIRQIPSDELKESANPLIILQFLSWSNNYLLLEKVKDYKVRSWYIKKCQAENWSYDTLFTMIKRSEHLSDREIASNFELRLTKDYARKVHASLKDPYIFDFLTLTEDFQEKELEHNLILNVEKFLLELGQGFAFVGRQYQIALNDKEYYLDLLFYNFKLHCFVVIELKKGEFKPEYAGKLNFYCNVVDDFLKYPQDEPTIGLILCQSNNKLEAEYTLRNIDKPIGVSEYELTKALPERFKSSLPSVEEIEAELGGGKYD